jgi:methyl acetate hydrolase
MSFSAGKLDRFLSRAVEEGRVPLVAATVASETETIYEGAAGVVGSVDGAVPVTSDTRFQIKSMTKPITSVAALKLAESGLLDFDAPVDTYRPEFADLQVLEGIDGGTWRMRRPATRATVGELLTHTAGLGYWFFNENLNRFEQFTGLPNVGASRNDFEALKAPLVADPGTTWVYGISYDWLGLVLETITGDSLDVVIENHVTGPLGMKRTSFNLDEHDQEREAPLHVLDPDGKWIVAGHAPIDRPWVSGGDGLHSTPRDYQRFAQMLLRNGELDGQRILRPDTVRTMFTSQIGKATFPDHIPSAVPELTDTFQLGTDRTWGYGLIVNNVDDEHGRRAGSGGWSGLFNTQFWVDHTAGLCGAIYTSCLPFMSAHRAAAVFAEFEAAVYAAH